MGRVTLFKRSISVWWIMNKENNEHWVKIFVLLVWHVRKGGYCFLSNLRIPLLAHSEHSVTSVVVFLERQTLLTLLQLTQL